MLMKDFGSTILLCTPSYALNLAEVMTEEGVDPATLKLKSGLFGAEPWTEAMRKGIERQLRLDAIDIYGLSEVIGPGVASECIEAKHGLHIFEDHFIAEVIDPATGTVLPQGEVGELVFTTISKEAFPVIRYRTRDISRLITTPCACGRTLVRMERISGRSDDMLIIRGVNVFPTQIEELILKLPSLSPHYVLEVTREGHLDELAVLVELKPDVAAASKAARQEMGHSLQHHIKSYIGISTEVKVVDVGTIERSIGKARRVIDKRPKD